MRGLLDDDRAVHVFMVDSAEIVAMKFKRAGFFAALYGRAPV